MVEGRFRYPSSRMLGDYARAGAGLLMTGVPVLAFSLNPWVAGALGSAAVLFAAFAGRTAQRHLTTVEVDEHGIRALGPLGGAVAWSELRSVRLSYYSTRRDRKNGWMQLTLRGAGTVTLESSIDGFDRIAERAAAVARAKRLELSETTLRNFAELGIDAEPGGV